MAKDFKWSKFFVIAFVFVLFAVNFAIAQDDDEDEANPPHYYYIQKYEGTKTCLKCHRKEAEDVFHSAHYQWSAAVDNTVIGLDKNRKHGKLYDLNDFCTNPGNSWIGRYTDKNGKVIVDGCSKCHIGYGKKPGSKMTEKELENIDCLMCHAPGYSRKVVKDKDGHLKWVPNGDPELITLRAKNVTKPTAGMCLKCHVGAGGGLNYKRGDLESAHYEADENLDVHFANDMTCIDCHETKNHRIPGRGNDIVTNDRPDFKVKCENCHDAEPHDSDILNRHTKTVYCTTCHIPDYARVDASDVYRDWRKLEKGENGAYDEYIVMKKHIKPVYRWWNGTTVAHDAKRPVKVVDGYVQMALPLGSKDDPNSKIYPFRVHVAVLPLLKKTKQLIPVGVNVAKTTGDIDKAVKDGAKSFYGKDIKTSDYTWVKAKRYMGLNHEVVGGKLALKCQDCHSKHGRMDWKALGYKGDPRKFGGRFSSKKSKKN